MNKPAHVDVVIFGGGVAGLWTRCVLSKRGYSVVLIDDAPFGTGQTLASQGIIHAGVKYALSGKAGRASRVLADASTMWRKAMLGEGEVDLRALRVVAEKMYIWTRAEKSSKLAAWGASKAMRSGVCKIATDHRPPHFSGASDGIDVYEVDEPVIDPADLLRLLNRSGSGPCLRMHASEAFQFETDAHDSHAESTDATMRLDVTLAAGGQQSLVAQRVVLCAGIGNEALLGLVNEDPALAQRRPLHMVIVRNAPIPLFGHCVRMSDVPLFTVTTSEHDEGIVWLVGGDLAEKGVAFSRDEQIAAARRELAQGLPWLDFNGCEFDTFRVDRAEGRTPGGKRPDEPVVVERSGIVAAWPTKLVLAPVMANQIADLFERGGLRQTVGDTIADSETVEIGLRPWETGGTP